MQQTAKTCKRNDIYFISSKTTVHFVYIECLHQVYVTTYNITNEKEEKNYNIKIA